MLAAGIVSPDSAEEATRIYNKLQVINPECYSWVKELERAGWVIRLKPVSFQSGDKYYAVPALGIAAVRSEATHHTPERTKSTYLDGKHASQVAADTFDWGKWGAIAGIVAVPLTVLLWWFS
jgi:hypothetical protein